MIPYRLYNTYMYDWECPGCGRVFSMDQGYHGTDGYCDACYEEELEYGWMP